MAGHFRLFCVCLVCFIFFLSMSLYFITISIGLVDATFFAHVAIIVFQVPLFPLECSMMISATAECLVIGSGRASIKTGSVKTVMHNRGLASSSLHIVKNKYPSTTCTCTVFFMAIGSLHCISFSHGFESFH